MESALLRQDMSVTTSPIDGFGVFANQDIKKGDIIEECYTLLTKSCDCLKDHAFVIKGFNLKAIPFGYAPIFNHSKNQHNADYEFDFNRSIMTFTATRDIKKGEEILIYYGDRWFEKRGYVEANISTLPYLFRNFFQRYRKVIRAIGLTVFLVLATLLAKSFA